MITLSDARDLIVNFRDPSRVNSRDPSVSLVFVTHYFIETLIYPAFSD